MSDAQKLLAGILLNDDEQDVIAALDELVASLETLLEILQAGGHIRWIKILRTYLARLLFTAEQAEWEAIDGT